jgi:hypothetical protein
MRKNDDVAEGKDGKRTSCHCEYMGGLLRQRNGLAERDL